MSWKGFGYEENSWEDEKDVDAPDLIREFYRSHPGAPRRIRAIQFGQLPFQFARADTAPKRGGSVKGTPLSELRVPQTTITTRRQVQLRDSTPCSVSASVKHGTRNVEDHFRATLGFWDWPVRPRVGPCIE